MYIYHWPVKKFHSRNKWLKYAWQVRRHSFSLRERMKGENGTAEQYILQKHNICSLFFKTSTKNFLLCMRDLHTYRMHIELLIKNRSGRVWLFLLYFSWYIMWNWIERQTTRKLRVRWALSSSRQRRTDVICQYCTTTVDVGQCFASSFFSSSSSASTTSYYSHMSISCIQACIRKYFLCIFYSYTKRVFAYCLPALHSLFPSLFSRHRRCCCEGIIHGWQEEWDMGGLGCACKLKKYSDSPSSIPSLVIIMIIIFPHRVVPVSVITFAYEQREHTYIKKIWIFLNKQNKKEKEVCEHKWERNAEQTDLLKKNEMRSLLLRWRR